MESQAKVGGWLRGCQAGSHRWRLMYRLGQRRSDKRISTYATQPGCLAEERLMPGRGSEQSLGDRSSETVYLSMKKPTGTAAAELSCGRSASTNSAASKKSKRTNQCCTAWLSVRVLILPYKHVCKHKHVQARAQHHETRRGHRGHRSFTSAIHVS